MAEEKIVKPVLEEVSAVRSYQRSAFYNGLLGGSSRQTIPRYRKLLEDDQVKSVWQQRRRAVTSVNWEIEPGGDSALDIAAADDLAEQIGDLSFDRITGKMLHALFFGYSVGECMFAAEAGKIKLKDVLVRRPERFRLGKGGDIFLIDTLGHEEEMPPQKLWVFADDSDNDDDLHGPGLGHNLYWPVFFKKNGAQFWAIALEKFGQPTPIGKFPAGLGDAEINKILDALNAIHTDSSIAIPDNVEISLLEAMRTSGGNFETFLNYFDGSISKVILSQTMTTDSGSSLAQAAVHADVKIEVVRGDADLICESFNNGPARWLTLWNYPGAAFPKIWRRVKDPEDLTDRATREKLVSETTGLRPTREHVEDYYGGKWEEIPATTLAPTPVQNPVKDDPAFATADPNDDTDETTDLTLQLEQMTNAAATAMIDEIRKGLESAADLAAFAESLLDAYPNMDVAPFKH